MRGLLLMLVLAALQLAAQKEVMGEQAHNAKGLEAALHQLEERCTDLKEASSGHEERAREAAAEAAKAARTNEKLAVSSSQPHDTHVPSCAHSWSQSKRKACLKMTPAVVAVASCALCAGSIVMGTL